MKDFKKILLASFLIAGFSSVAMAVDTNFVIPKGVGNIPDTSAKYGSINASKVVTSTTPALLTDADGNTITSGLIYWIVRPSTGAYGSVYCEFRDTNTANSSSTKLIPWIAPSYNGASGALSTSTIPVDPVVKFDPPIPFYNGLSVNLLPAGAAPASGVEYAVGVRKRKAN